MKNLLTKYLNFIKKYTPDLSLLGVRAILAVGFFGPAMMKVQNIDAIA